MKSPEMNVRDAIEKITAMTDVAEIQDFIEGDEPRHRSRIRSRRRLSA